MNIVEEIKNDINGIDLLSDWLGTGQPVGQIVAELRSERCAVGNDGKPCPLNVAPNWWDRVKSEIADWIRHELELKNKLMLSVPQEHNLHMCKACGCCLRLKVWTPAIHLRGHVSEKQIEQTPSYCWMRKELT